VAAKPPFAGDEWVPEGNAFVRAGTGDRWSYNEAQDQWRWTCTDDQWNAVLAAVAELPLLSPDDFDATRGEYNDAASDYLALAFHHHARFAKGSPAKIWRKKRKHILAALLLDAERSTSLSFEFHLKEALHIADAAVVAFEMEGTLHTGRRNPERDWLYNRLMGIWTRHFGGKLTTGRTTDKETGKQVATSPAIRFLLAALTPILRDDMIGAEAIEKIIEAEIARQKRHTVI